MNALYLKDLADKTRRGLRGRVEAGKSGGRLCFGYRVVRTIGADGVVTGEREIEPSEAATVVRIFTEYAGGISPQTIAKGLNADNIRGPHGAAWGPSTIQGHAPRGPRVLNNELYFGRLVWNRQRYVKDPDTGRRVSRMNAESEWTRTDVPSLRIVSDDLWQRAKARQAAARLVVREGGNARHAHRPQYLFSGLVRCGLCGSSYTVYSTHRLACTGNRERGICANRLAIRREDVEQRVLAALQTRFFTDDAFQVFCQEFRSAVNEARMEARANTSAAEREREKLDKEIEHIVQDIMDGLSSVTLRQRLLKLEARKAELAAEAVAVQTIPPLLHPNLADRWMAEITELREALEEDRCDPEAREAVRHMVDEIRLTPREGTLAIDVKGNLAAMLNAASPGEDWQRQMTLVAGARSQLYLAFCSTAA